MPDLLHPTAMLGTAVTELVYRKELRRVIRTGAVLMDPLSHTTSVGSRCESDGPGAWTEPRQAPVLGQWNK